MPPDLELKDVFDERYGHFVRTSGAEWMMYKCPHCARNALACNIVHGYVRCHHCGHKDRVNGRANFVQQRVYDLKLQARIVQSVLGSPAARIQPAYLSFLKDRMIFNPRAFQICTADWDLSTTLRARGFTDTEMADSGLFHYNQQGTLVPGACLKPGRLLIPYWSNGQCVTFKSRVSLREELDTNSVKYLTAPGLSISHYLWHMTVSGSDLFITEGELKALTALCMGVHAASIPGLQAWRQLRTQIRALSSRYRRVFIVLDSDPGYETSRAHLGAALGIAQFTPNSCILFLPQTRACKKMALDTFLIENEEDAFWDLVEQTWQRRKQIHEHYRNKLLSVVKD